MKNLTIRDFRSMAIGFFGKKNVYLDQFDNPTHHNFLHLSYAPYSFNVLNEQNIVYAEKPLNNPFYDMPLGHLIIGGLCVAHKKNELVYTKRILSRIKTITVVAKNDPDFSASFHLNCSFKDLRNFSKKLNLKYRISTDCFCNLNEEDRKLLSKSQRIYTFDKYWYILNQLVQKGIFQKSLRPQTTLNSEAC